jgi:hypothetical protein
MLLDPFLYDFVAEHQCALREAAERARHGGERGPGWWRLLLGMSAAVESRRVPSGASPRPVCRRPLACRHASRHA